MLKNRRNGKIKSKLKLYYFIYFKLDTYLSILSRKNKMIRFHKKLNIIQSKMNDIHGKTKQINEEKENASSNDESE